MKLGFTGTQVGMSKRQAAEFVRILHRNSPTEFHHGDCVGADAEAAVFVSGLTRAEVHVHPPVDESKRAFAQRPGNVVHEAKPYLERNHDIVDATDELVAAPRTDMEELRSGTWATIRYARKMAKKVTVLPR